MCCVEELAQKDVINISDGCRLGFVGDVEIDTDGGRVASLVVFGRAKFFGLLGRGDDLIVPWEDIQKIGADIILVSCAPRPRPRPPKRGFFASFGDGAER
jgi:YlmC/YmxH family sporulation protein